MRISFQNHSVMLLKHSLVNERNDCLKNNLKQPNLPFIKTILMKNGTLRLVEMPVFTVINVFQRILQILHSFLVQIASIFYGESIDEEISGARALPRALSAKIY